MISTQTWQALHEQGLPVPPVFDGIRSVEVETLPEENALAVLNQELQRLHPGCWLINARVEFLSFNPDKRHRNQLRVIGDLYMMMPVKVRRAPVETES